MSFFFIEGTFCCGGSKNFSLKMQRLFVEQPIDEAFGFDTIVAQIGEKIK